MINKDLLFFCTICREKSDDEIAKIKCSIPHTVKLFKRGELIAYHSEPINQLIMLTKGKVKIEIVSNSGVTLPVKDIEAPYPLSASFLFADDNRLPVDIVALTECEIVYIRKEAIEKQIMACPGFMRGFLAFNSNHTQYISERLKIFAQRGIKAKAVYYILSKEKNGEFEIDLSISALAEYFGVERSSLSRVFSELIKKGIIEFDTKKGRILDMKSLLDYYS